MNNAFDILTQKDFSFSAEIIPPRNGTDFTEIFEQIKLFSQADFRFISVTHGAGGSLRGGTLPICHFAQNTANILSIAHLTCRGVTREDLENTLIDHHYFSIHNILALRGDPPDGIGAVFQKAEGGFSYAYELIELIHNMNQGKYIPREKFDQDTKFPTFREGISTNFCIGAACYPEDPVPQNIEYLKIKKKKGQNSLSPKLFIIWKTYVLFIKK